MRPVFASGCLGLARLRYDGRSIPVRSPHWDRWVAQGRLVQLCPEVAAGLPVPREPAEIVGGTAADVLAGDARVLGITGTDLTDVFLRAADLAVRQVRAYRPALAVLVDKSPSCGSTTVYDGMHSGVRVPGRGLTAEVLRREGVPVFTLDRLDEAAIHLAQVDAGTESPD